jgi:hypothetical protein
MSNKLILESVNGLMNRFRSIASSKILSEFTNREFLLNWKPEYVCNVRISDLVEDGFFNIGYDVDRQNCYYHSGYEKGSEQPFIDEMISTDKEIIYLIAGGNFIPTGMSISEFNNKKSDFYSSIPFVERIRNESNNFFSKNDDYIGIHLRYTDRIEYSPTIDYVENIINNNETNIFICSDDRNVLSNLKSKFGDRILTYYTTNLDRSSIDGSQQAIIEWLILANSKKIYYSAGSSYSYEACFINKLDNSIELNSRNNVNDIKIDLKF